MKKIIIYLVFVLTISCNVQMTNNCDYLKLLKSFKIDDCSEWYKNFEKPNNVDELLIEYERERGDTLWNLQLIVKFNDNNKQVIDEKMFVSIVKDSLMQKANLISNKDTSFIYTTSLYNKGEFVFVVGKYEYLYTSMELNWGQRLYYEKYRDSLKLIRGNNLPPLPELEENEDEEPQTFEAID